MSDCIFCKIINGELPATVVYEDDHVLAFKDINPQAPVHIVCAAKKHINSIKEVNESDWNIVEDILKACNQVAADMKVAGSGYRLMTNIGKNGGQMVDHLHFHLLGGKYLDEK